MSELRRTILDASVEMVAEEGVRALSFRAVARKAGVSHQAPYHIFGNHRGILEAIAREGFSNLTKAMREGADARGPDALDALVGSGLAYVEYAWNNLGHFRVMFQESLVATRDPENPLEEALETHGTLRDLAAEAFDAGYGRGLDPEAMALVCWSCVHGLASLLNEGIVANKGDLKGQTIKLLTEQCITDLGRLLGS